MNNIYFFSKSNFKLKNCDKVYDINKNSTIKISDYDNNNKIEIFNIDGSKKINLQFLKSCNYYNYWNYNGDNFVEIISTSYDNLVQKISSENFEVLIYKSAIRLFVNNICYCHTFIYEYQTYAMQKEKCIYIFNSKNLIIFNKENLSFSFLYTSKFLKNNKNIEILCKIPQNNQYFLHFLFNLDKNNLNIKKLKNQNINNTSLHYLCFNLCKYNFDEAKNLFNKNLDYEKIKQYFSCFDQIIEINNKYYLHNLNELTEVKFTIKEDIIEDVD